MADIEAIPAPRSLANRLWRASEWMRRGRPVTVSPLGGLALAAGFAALLFLGRAWLTPQPEATGIVGPGAMGPSVAQFVIVAPAAGSVSLVGDFNDWSAAASPMQQEAGNGVWSITIPLDPGRYRYAFLVDGTTWLGDPSAPPAWDEFGRPGSVVTIGEL
jgi:hypothetical protein